MDYSVVYWNNDGKNFYILVRSLKEAQKIAKQKRNLQNKTVKIKLLEDTIYHWSRSIDANLNNWSRRAVKEECVL